MMSFFSRIGQFAVFPLPLKETMQIDRFEQNKAAHLRKIKLVTTSSVTYFFTLVSYCSVYEKGWDYGSWLGRQTGIDSKLPFTLPPCKFARRIRTACLNPKQWRWFAGALRQYASSARKKTHVCKSPACYTLGLGVLPPTGATANILVRGAQCRTSPTFASQTDVRHPPPGYPNLLPYNTGYPGLSRLIPHRGLSRDIPG